MFGNTEVRATALVRRATPPASAGALAMLSLGPWGWWPVAFAGVAWLLHQLRDLSPRDRFRRSWWFWFGAYLVGLIWMIDLTLPGWLIAVPVEATIMAVPFALVPNGAGWRLAAVPGALVVGEAVRWVVPFGGVPMGNLALGQVDAPWAETARVGGALLLIAMIGLGAAALHAYTRSRRASAWGLACFVALWTIGERSPDGHAVAEIEAAVVQAGGQLGTNAATTVERPVFDRHVEAMRLLDQDVDLIVWSESSAVSDGPLGGSVQALAISALAADHGAVIVANFSERSEDSFLNTAVAFEPDGRVADTYTKVHLVPFGEYVPLRGFIENFVDLSLIPREAIPGDGPGLLRTSLGPMSAVISFEIYFPERVRSGVAEQGRLIVNPTLASSYTTTLVPEQSLASARLRAIESGRWTLQASTTGYSAIVDHRGDVIARTGLREQAVKVATVELREGTTWAIRWGKSPVTLAAMVALAGCGLTIGPRRRITLRD